MLMTMSGTWTCFAGVLWLMTSFFTLHALPAERFDKHLLESLMVRQAIFRGLKKAAALSEDPSPVSNLQENDLAAGHVSNGLLVKKLKLLPGMGDDQKKKKNDEKIHIQDTAVQRLATARSSGIPHQGALFPQTEKQWPVLLSTAAARPTNLDSHILQPTELHEDEGFFSASSSDSNNSHKQSVHLQTQPRTYKADTSRERGDLPLTYSNLYGTVDGGMIYSTKGEQKAEPATDAHQVQEEQNDESTGSSEERRIRAVSRYPTPKLQTMPTPHQRRHSTLEVTTVTRPNPDAQNGTKNTRQPLHSSPKNSYPAMGTFSTTRLLYGARELYDDYYPTPPATKHGDTSMNSLPKHPPAPDTLSRNSLFRGAHTLAPTAAPQTLAPWPTRAPPTRVFPQTSTTPFAQPTPRVPLLGQDVGSEGESPVSKRTRDPTPPSSTPEAVCLQYLRVEHDVDCSHRSRRSVPSTRHLTLLLQHLGGSPSSPFTAPTLQEAVSRFRNLMPLGIPDVDEHIHLKFTTSQIQELLDKYYAEKNQSQSTKSVPLFENGSASKQEADDLQLPVDFLQQMVPAKQVTFNSTLRRSRRSFDPANHQSYACPSSVDCAHFHSSQCPNGQTEMVVDENDCDTCQCAGAGGYCQRSGAQGAGVQNPRTRLCTQCQRVRHLGPNVFPSYLQEVVCHPSRAPCLDIGGALGPQGQCQESQVPVSVLRRNPGRCMRIELTNGQSLVFDDWRLTQQMVRTGCQCMVDKRSPVAAVLPRS